MSQNLIEIKEHTRRKYRILRKYLRACEHFSKKYRNFAYVETHGGTGRVFDLNEKKEIDGSTRIAGNLEPSFPCYSIEIDSQRSKILKRTTEDLPNVKVYKGDCNEEIDKVLEEIPEEKFTFFFVDPDSLVYNSGDYTCDQLKYETVGKIRSFRRSEILLNLPTYTITRLAGFVKSNPRSPSSIGFEKRIATLYGTDLWKDLDPGDYRSFTRLFISDVLRKYFKYIGALLIRSVVNNAPLYYLIYGSNHEVGGKIMRSNMKIEWLDMKETEPLSKYQYDTEKDWLNVEYPLSLFIFED